MTVHLVVVGDALLDVDVVTRADRLAPDAPAPVLVELGRQSRPGGAALAALVGARMPGVEVTLVSPLVDDEEAMEVQAWLAGEVEVVPVSARGRTPVKKRIRAAGNTVARLDSGGDVTITQVSPHIGPLLASADAVLVSDYGGSAARDDRLRSLLLKSDRPLVWDPHPRGGLPIAGSALVTPNLSEAQSLSGVGTQRGGHAPLTEVGRAAITLRERWGALGVCVTLGDRGALLATGSDELAYLPAAYQVGGDACGAGDCFAVAATAALGRGSLPSEAVSYAVRSAATFLSRGGVTSLVQHAEVARDAIDPITRVREAGGVVVATGGCFDLLHAGHIQTISAARSLGDCLIVLLNSDSSVRNIKGPGRPLQTAVDRARVLSALRDVDAVVVFEEESPQRSLSELRPDIWVKGGDYSTAQLPEAELVRSWGGAVITVGYIDGKSTSTLVQLARQ